MENIDERWKDNAENGDNTFFVLAEKRSSFPAIGGSIIMDEVEVAVEQQQQGLGAA